MKSVAKQLRKPIQQTLRVVRDLAVFSRHDIYFGVSDEGISEVFAIIGDDLEEVL